MAKTLTLVGTDHVVRRFCRSYIRPTINCSYNNRLGERVSVSITFQKMEVENGFEMVDDGLNGNRKNKEVTKEDDAVQEKRDDITSTDVQPKEGHSTPSAQTIKLEKSFEEYDSVAKEGLEKGDVSEKPTGYSKDTRASPSKAQPKKSVPFTKPTSVETQTIPEKIYQTVLSLVCFISLLIALPFLLPISLLFRIYRHTLLFIISRQRKDVDMVSGSDSVWLQDSEANPAVINSILVVKGTPSIKPFQERLMERLVDAKVEGSDRRLLPKVKQYASTIYHRYVWIDEENFDIDQHMYVHDSPAPKDMDELQLMVGEICSKPLPQRKAAWQFILLKYADPPSGESPDNQTFYIIFRVHHAIADGISLVKLLVHKMVDKVPEEMLKTTKRFGSKGFLSKALKAVFEGPALLLERVIWPADHHFLHNSNALSGTKLVAWSDPLELGLVKQMKNATGTTVNDVLVSCLAGAFGEYFKKYSSDIPNEIKAYVPVDIRPQSQKEIILDNEFALVFLSLPVDVTDPVENLFKVKARMDKIKTSPEPIVTSLAVKYAMARLPNWLTRWSCDWLSDKCSLVLSNVPGPQEKMTMVGQVLDDMLFWPPQRSNIGKEFRDGINHKVNMKVRVHYVYLVKL